MIERVFSTIKKHNLIDKGESVIVGVSGGGILFASCIFCIQ
jgi:tRNA(Ile)-lysidine synthase TilS/MesJ